MTAKRRMTYSRFLIPGHQRISWIASALFNMRVINVTSFAAVAIEPFAFSWIVRDVLLQTLTYDKAYQRLRAVVDRLMSHTVDRKADKISRANFLRRVANDRRTVTR